MKMLRTGRFSAASVRERGGPPQTMMGYPLAGSCGSEASFGTTDIKGLSMNNIYTLLPARRPAAAGGHLLQCRFSTIYTDIACVAAPRIRPPGARAKVQTLFIDRL
jgi:hypothetical protein